MPRLLFLSEDHLIVEDKLRNETILVRVSEVVAVLLKSDYLGSATCTQGSATYVTVVYPGQAILIISQLYENSFQHFNGQAFCEIEMVSIKRSTQGHMGSFVRTRTHCKS